MYGIRIHATGETGFMGPRFYALALARYFNVVLHRVHVVTSIVAAGMVVENGKEVTW